MATKYAGQNALNKLMQLVKTAINNKADKSALDEKLDKSGGTITGGLNVNGSLDVGSTLSTKLMAMTPTLVLHDEAKEVAVYVTVAGDNAAKVTSPVPGGGTKYARVEVGTPTGDNDATTKGYVDRKVADGGVTVDTAMSSTSTNPVQNKVITAALAGKAGTAAATTSANGLMSAADKKKLDGVADGANKTTVDSAMSASSTNPVQNKIVKNYVDNKVSGFQTASQVQDAIKSAVSGVYTPKGSVAFASLPVPVAGKVGWVYNITDAFTTDSNFVEGEGRDYPAGTNVVCAEISAGDYGWDVLAGIIDLAELTAVEVQTLWDSI